MKKPTYCKTVINQKIDVIEKNIPRMLEFKSLPHY